MIRLSFVFEMCVLFFVSFYLSFGCIRLNRLFHSHNRYFDGSSFFSFQINRIQIDSFRSFSFRRICRIVDRPECIQFFVQIHSLTSTETLFIFSLGRFVFCFGFYECSCVLVACIFNTYIYIKFFFYSYQLCISHSVQYARHTQSYICSVYVYTLHKCKRINICWSLFFFIFRVWMLNGTLLLEFLYFFYSEYNDTHYLDMIDEYTQPS